MGAGLEEADWGGGTGGEYAELPESASRVVVKIFIVVFSYFSVSKLLFITTHNWNYHYFDCPAQH